MQSDWLARSSGATTLLLAVILGACGPEPVDPFLDERAAASELTAATASQWIYQSALVTPWVDYSWASRNLAATSPVAAGSTRSIAVTFGPWQGLYFHRTSIAASDYSALVLQVNGGTNSHPTLQVRAVLDSGAATTGVDLGSSCSGGFVPTNAWTSCAVPFASIAPAGSKVTGIVIQEWSGKTLARTYFDAIGLRSAAAPQVAVSVSPTTAALAPGASAQFAATVSGSANTGVTWTVQEGSAGGGVSSTGLYTAPPSAGTFHVVATSNADPSKSAAATVTVSSATCGTACAGGKESWVWVYTDYANVLQAIAANKAAFTNVSPTFYTVNYGYQSGVAYYSNCPNVSSCTGNGSNSFSGLTTKQFTDQVRALGLQTHPAIYGGAANGGTDIGVKNILENANGAGDAFVSSMTAEAVANGYDGYNLDWEVGSAIDRTYVDKFIAFANKFKAALAAHGMSLSVDAIVSNINGTWCSGNDGFLDFPKLATSSVDRIIIEDYVNTLGPATTSCQNVVLSSTSPPACAFNLTGELNLMCSPNLPVDKAVIGLMADPNQTNPIAGAAFSTIESYGFTRVAVWPQAPFMNNSGIQPAGATWYGLLQGFLAP